MVSRPSENPCRAEALRLKELGYRPLAVDPATKAPWYPWKLYQTTAPTQQEIDAWFTLRPDAGVGITTTGILVVDIDGPTTFWPPAPDHALDLMGVPKAQTPRGGYHLWFRQTPGRKYSNTAGTLADHVDTRADGGFLVVPPTVRKDGTRYEWLGEDIDCSPWDLPLPPPWLDQMLAETTTVSIYETKPLATTIPHGQRNKTYFRLACLLRDAGADEQFIRATLDQHNDEQPEPLPAQELAKIAASAAKFEPKPDVDLSLILSPKRSTRVLSMGELQQLPPVTWLIPDIIPDRGFGMIVGAPGSGKSLLALAIANSIARGIPLLGNGSPPTRTGWSLVLLAEAAASWAARSRAFNSHYAVDLTDDFAAIIDGVNFANSDSINSLHAVIGDEVKRRGCYPALIILDTLSASIPGLDENSQAAVTPLTATLQRWTARGIPTVAIHHPSKNGAAYRGSSVLMGSVDWMLGVEVHGKRRELVWHKLRDFDGAANLAFEIVAHGDSIVAVPCAGASPLFVAFSEPGLKDALLDHAFVYGDREARCPVRGLDIAKGITLRDVLTTWNDVLPVQPTSAMDRDGYNAEVKRRTRVLITLLQALVDDGTLRSDKKLTTRDASAKVWQVVA